MAFDPTLPATGVTTFGNLYAILRANFVGLGVVEAWTNVSSLGANWVAQTTVSHMKDPMGFVYLKGYGYASGTASATLFTLPSGYRPAQTFKKIGGVNAANVWPGQIIIATDGTVTAEFYSNNDQFFLDGITFKAT